jgi:hypothetical protein
MRRVILYVSQIPETLENINERVGNAVCYVYGDVLENVWQEGGYYVDVCKATNGPQNPSQKFCSASEHFVTFPSEASFTSVYAVWVL